MRRKLLGVGQRALATLIEKIGCLGGHTRIGRMLNHARAENTRQKKQALVFTGDAMEEAPFDLYDAARRLGLVAKVFREIARRTNRAYCRFDGGAADQLRDLLRAVAAYAAGGQKALLQSGSAGAVKLLQQLGG